MAGTLSGKRSAGTDRARGRAVPGGHVCQIQDSFSPAPLATRLAPAVILRRGRAELSEQQNQGPRTVGDVLSGMRLSTAIAVLGFIVVAVGSIGPWVDTFIGSADGLRGDGRISLGAAIVAVAVLATGRGRPWAQVVAWIAAAVALGTAGYDFVHIRHEATRAVLFGHQIADVGWGPVAVIGGATLALTALAAEARPPPRWGLTALAASVAIGLIIGGAAQQRTSTGNVAQSIPTIPTVPDTSSTPTDTTTTDTTTSTPTSTSSCYSSHTAYFPCATASAPYCEQGQCSYPAPTSGECATGYTLTSSGSKSICQRAIAATPQTSANALAGLPTQCSPNLAASESISCGLANNVFYEYYKATQSDGDTTSLSAWSPATHQYYTASCDAGPDIITCAISGTSDPSAQVEFTQAAVNAYAPQAANAFASRADLGPNG